MAVRPYVGHVWAMWQASWVERIWRSVRQSRHRCRCAGLASCHTIPSMLGNGGYFADNRPQIV